MTMARIRKMSRNQFKSSHLNKERTRNKQHRLMTLQQHTISHSAKLLTILILPRPRNVAASHDNHTGQRHHLPPMTMMASRLKLLPSRTIPNDHIHPHQPGMLPHIPPVQHRPHHGSSRKQQRLSISSAKTQANLHIRCTQPIVLFQKYQMRSHPYTTNE